jgi:acetyltransferase-like isoleucine patch superfamily enzyme
MAGMKTSARVSAGESLRQLAGARPLELLPRLVAATNARWQLRSATLLGPRVTLRGRLALENQGRMVFGDRVRLVSTPFRLELVTMPGGELDVGHNVFINFGTSIVASKLISIGNDCLIGTHVMVMDCDFHRVVDKAWDTTGYPVTIEDRVWLANRSIVLKGVRVGHDSVVAAGAVVTRDVPPRSVVAGKPARVVRTF